MYHTGKLNFSCLLWLFSLISFDLKNSVEDILQVLIVFCVESLELDFALLFPERHTLLRVLPVLVVLATSSEKESESLYKRVKMNRLLNIFKVRLPSCPDSLLIFFGLSEYYVCYLYLPFYLMFFLFIFGRTIQLFQRFQICISLLLQF